MITVVALYAASITLLFSYCGFGYPENDVTPYRGIVEFLSVSAFHCTEEQSLEVTDYHSVHKCLNSDFLLSYEQMKHSSLSKLFNETSSIDKFKIDINGTDLSNI